MSHMFKEVQIDVSPEQVWPVIADLGTVVNFHPFVSNSYYHSSELKGEGASRVCEFGGEFAVLETAVDWNEGQSYTLAIDVTQGIKPPISDILATVAIRPDGEGGSIASIDMRYKPKFGPIGVIMDKLMVQPKYGNMLDGMMKGLKHHTETGEVVDVSVLKRISVQPAAAA